jgi:hypothetical protein
MKNKNVMQAKKEFVQFLKRHKAVAVYFWTVYGYEPNSRIVKEILAKIEYETRPKQLCRLYEDLLGRLRKNPNIKDREYWDNDTLYFVYKNWCEHVRNKFHIPHLT